MLSDLPGLEQWTADRFWSQIQWVANQGRTQKARLDAQKLELQHAYTAARSAGDQTKMAALQPLIHKNSELRVQWNELRAKFNTVVENARGFLAQHGIHEAPTLADLGQLETIVVPVAWVLALIAVIVIINAITSGIRAVDDGLKALGPVGSTAISLGVLGAVGLAIYLFVFKPHRGASA